MLVTTSKHRSRERTVDYLITHSVGTQLILCIMSYYALWDSILAEEEWFCSTGAYALWALMHYEVIHYEIVDCTYKCLDFDSGMCDFRRNGNKADRKREGWKICIACTDVARKMCLYVCVLNVWTPSCAISNMLGPNLAIFKPRTPRTCGWCSGACRSYNKRTTRNLSTSHCADDGYCPRNVSTMRISWHMEQETDGPTTAYTLQPNSFEVSASIRLLSLLHASMMIAGDKRLRLSNSLRHAFPRMMYSYESTHSFGCCVWIVAAAIPNQLCGFDQCSNGIW
jgi:hypothetical protein